MKYIEIKFEYINTLKINRPNAHKSVYLQKTTYINSFNLLNINTLQHYYTTLVYFVTLNCWVCLSPISIPLISFTYIKHYTVVTLNRRNITP